MGTAGRMSVRSEGVVAQPPPGAGPDSPAQVPAAGWRDVLRRTGREMVADRITIIAAGVAFYWFLAIFPLLFAAIGLLDVVNASPATGETVNDAIRRAFFIRGVKLVRRRGCFRSLGRRHAIISHLRPQIHVFL